MPRIDEATRLERLERIQRLLLRHPLGLREAEIAQRTGLARRTVNDYLWSADLASKVYKEGTLWFAEPGAAELTLRPVHLTPEQAVTLYLAARLLVKQHDKRNEAAETALLKLADALRSDTDVGREVYQAVEELATRPGDGAFGQVFSTVVQGFVYKRVVRMVYRPLHGQPFECRFSPYLLEPSAVGRTTYAIGYSEPPGALRTRKLERILEAELTRQSFEVPPDFPGLEILRSAWSVIFGEERVEVRLRFNARAAERVRETRWHPTQRIESTDDGGCLWTAQVADVTDMLPWLRGWGADVEVVGPEALRGALVSETRRLAALYNIQPVPTYQLLWAKTSRDKSQTHPLICHMIDVGQVALALWNEVLMDGLRQQFAATLGVDMAAAGWLIAFWAGLHDLGKACPCFQRKYRPAEAILSEAGLRFPRRFVQEACYHGTISAESLATLLEAETGLSSGAAKDVARAVGGHHGVWPHPRDIGALRSTELGGDDWITLRRDLLQTLVTIFGPPAIEQLAAGREEWNALIALLSGLTSTADWIGSMDRYFPYVPGPVDPAQYAHAAKRQARLALRELGWTGWQPSSDAVSFQELFGFGPRSMQDAVIELAQKLDGPALVIIEAPTGVGKTEAALFLADDWARRHQQRGLYVAMPTMATSNQMFGRVRKVLADRYPADLVNLHLIHSQARWRDDMESLRLETMDERESGTVAAMAWFLPRKRSLLAPFGVGTVDQALLSVLQARHFFVRLFGLSHKTIVFDEVHAYDTYMSTIFQRLLGWLRSIGTSVVILSATLPAQTRRELLEAYTGQRDAASPEVSYPAITWATVRETGAVLLESPTQRSIALEWAGREPADMVEQLSEALRAGGCAAVICNTVKRAQEVYAALREAGIVPEQDLILFHARFPFAWREAIEQEVLARFGKQGDRSRKSVVVATHVIEQSLDLDFDLMITDLAPVDLLLQRAGRLHRHQRAARPAPLSRPRLLVTMPAEKAGVPDFGSDAYVYEPYVLLRSYLALQGREQLTLPQETEMLIEAVYGEEPPTLDSLSPELEKALADGRERMGENRLAEQHEARQRLVPEPGNRRLMNVSQGVLEEDRPEVHRALQALIRLIPPSVSVVCLHQTAAGLALEPDVNGPIVDLAQAPGPELTRELALRSVSVTHQRVVQYLLTQPEPSGWSDHPLLRTHRVAIFADGRCSLGDSGYALQLSRELGLEIHKEVA